MQPQNWERKKAELTQRFREALQNTPSLCEQSLKLSWSNWGFGIEPLDASAARLRNAGCGADIHVHLEP